MVLIELIFNSFYLGGCGGLERTDFLTVYTLGRCGVLKELIFNSFFTWSRCGGLEIPDFLTVSFFGKVWWS